MVVLNIKINTKSEEIYVFTNLKELSFVHQGLFIKSTNIWRSHYVKLNSFAGKGCLKNSNLDVGNESFLNANIVDVCEQKFNQKMW